MKKITTPSEIANPYGVTIADIVRHTGKPRRTIERWSVKFPALFVVVCKGVKRQIKDAGLNAMNGEADND